MEEAPYNLLNVVNAIDNLANVFLFVGTAEAEALRIAIQRNDIDPDNSLRNPIRVNAIAFPYTYDEDGAVLPDGKGKRWLYTGRLLSWQQNPSLTRGQALFEDGTKIYYDTRVLK